MKYRIRFNKKHLIEIYKTVALPTGPEIVVMPCKSRQELITSIEKIKDLGDEGRNNKKFIFRLDFEDASWLFEKETLPSWVNFEFTKTLRKMNGTFRKASIPYHLALQGLHLPNNIECSIGCFDGTMVYKLGEEDCTYATFLNKQTKLI